MSRPVGMVPSLARMAVSTPDDFRMPLVCFSHLRWGFVWQRPQHIMTRLAHVHAVYFVEEPILESDTSHPRLDVTSVDGITLLVPVLPAFQDRQGGFNDQNNKVIRALLSNYLERETGTRDLIAWYYTPMAFGALPSTMTPVVSVYDAMDELANFRHAPADLVHREAMLMNAVDLVFSGGPGLHDARKNRHPNAHCFPSGVDEEHFRYGGHPVPEDISEIPGPIVGFYGVLDERVDFGLIDSIAELRPDWSIVMIGPIVKIQVSELARRSNIHYLGMRRYDDLPRYLARFDAAILPFAINEATQFISPTKTLEYLAGAKPVVSTPIRDVTRLYGEVVEFADTPNDFISAIERLWDETEVARAMRRHLVERLLAKHHWDVITAHMRHLIQSSLSEAASTSTPIPPRDTLAPPARRSPVPGVAD